MARRKKNRVKRAVKKFFRNELVKSIFSGLLLLGILYFGVLGGLVLAFQNETPMRGVISGSMHHGSEEWREYYVGRGYDPSTFPCEGGFSKGDMVVIKGVRAEDLKIGDVIVYDVGAGYVPIVHRIAEIENSGGQLRFRTRGDNNLTLDPGWVYPEKIMGKVLFSIPYLGWPSVWAQGY
jgi:signal peptidase I